MSLLNCLQYCFCLIFWFSDHKVHEISVPWGGNEPTLPVLEGKVLTTGPPGKSQYNCLTCQISLKTTTTTPTVSEYTGSSSWPVSLTVSPEYSVLGLCYSPPPNAPEEKHRFYVYDYKSWGYSCKISDRKKAWDFQWRVGYFRVHERWPWAKL